MNRTIRRRSATLSHTKSGTRLGRLLRPLLAILGISTVAAALQAGDASASLDRERLERRVLAAREVLLARSPEFDGAETANPSRLAQWPNWGNWGNWGNWPNWNNWNNWFNWFNR